MASCSLIVHGGAGDDIPDALIPAFRDGVAEATRAGWAVLQQGGTALDAVEAAVRLLEDNPTYDAGRGSFANQRGEIEMDAFIMDGTTLANGAVAAIQRVRHPISVARLVMKNTPHCLLAGAGAEDFAQANGAELATIEWLLEGAEHGIAGVALAPGVTPMQDTVGAVARDSRGQLAAATSTGGIRNKLPGRVGDCPIIGSGGYADDDSGAASATGRGEDLMKIVVSKSVCDLMALGFAPQAAADAMIARLGTRVQGKGGIIVMNRHGEVAHAFNTLRMARSWVAPDGTIHAAV